MTPISLGIFASTVVPPAATSFESIATVTVSGSNVSSITFSSIPGTYTHLQIRAFMVSGLSANNQWRFNGDSGNNYTWHQLQGDGSGASVYASNPTSNPPWGLNSGNSSYPMVSIIESDFVLRDSRR